MHLVNRQFEQGHNQHYAPVPPPPAYIQHITQLMRNTYFEIYEIYKKSIYILQLLRYTYYEISKI
jgi:hypothetical protein